MSDIPLGYCQCGCGQKTRIAPQDSAEKGWVKGRPIRFIVGHNARIPDTLVTPPNPSGICQCGCGQKAPIAKQTSAWNGWVKGQPMRYIANHRPRVCPELRFWPKIEKRGPEECWPWRCRARTPRGYGLFSIGRQKFYAHRFAYELVNGPLSEGMEVLHTCDNPPCCNPAHLYPGTQQENNRDMKERGRMRILRGEERPNAKLSDGRVREIRKLYASGGVSYLQLAARFGVADSRIREIVRRKAWAHVL